MTGKNKKWAAPYSEGMLSAAWPGHGLPSSLHGSPRIPVFPLAPGKFYVIATAMLAVACVGLYLYITPKSYTATAQVLIDLNRPSDRRSAVDRCGYNALYDGSGD